MDLIQVENSNVLSIKELQSARTEVGNSVGFSDPLELISGALKESFNKAVLMNQRSGLQYHESFGFNTW